MQRRALTLFMIRQAGIEPGDPASPFWAVYWVRWNGRARRRINRAWRRLHRRAGALACDTIPAMALKAPPLTRGKSAPSKRYQVGQISVSGALPQRLQRTLRDDLADFEDFERQRVMLNLLGAEAARALGEKGKL